LSVHNFEAPAERQWATRPGWKIRWGTSQYTGTLSYCAPERLQFQRAEPAADVFSLGVVYYEMVTGRKPFPGDSRAMVMEHILHSRPVPPRLLKPQVPKVLSQLILAMPDKRPDRRCPTPRVLDVLSSLSHQENVDKSTNKM